MTLMKKYSEWKYLLFSFIKIFIFTVNVIKLLIIFKKYLYASVSQKILLLACWKLQFWVKQLMYKAIT